MAPLLQQVLPHNWTNVVYWSVYSDDTTKSEMSSTVPRDPVANDGLDNSEGNLIVFEGDVIVATNVQILKGGGVGTLRILDLLGTGDLISLSM
jgi:hypothetical protein